ncbi:MAG: glycosyltransferase family 4 protein [Pseudomonadota bacterium]
MKIALIQKNFSSHKGGAEQYAVNLAGALMRQGHEVTVFANQWDHAIVHGPKFQYVPIVKGPSFLQTISFVRNTQKALSKGKYDIVHSLARVFPQDVYRMSDGIYRYWLMVKEQNTLKRLMHFFSLRHLAILWIEKQIFAEGNFRRIIANSQLCKGHAIQYYNVDPSHITVIRNGVDFDRFNPHVRFAHREKLRKLYNIAERDTVILFVAMNFRRKGLVPLLKALSSLSNTDRVKLLVVGKGKKGYFKRLASKMGIGEKVIFAGSASKTEEYYGAADFFVLPTYYDPFANVCLEALACGLPVITTRTNGASELIEPGKNGFVVNKPDDIKELSEAIIKLMNPKLRNSTAENSFESVKNLTIEDHARKVCRVYEEILKEKRAKQD